MRRLFSHVLVAVFTFALGTTATGIVNFSEDSLVEYAEDGLLTPRVRFHMARSRT